MKSILHLNLDREYFAAIAALTKRIECRRRTPYWKRRLEGRHYDVIQFRNGYAPRAPVMLVEPRGPAQEAQGRFKDEGCPPFLAGLAAPDGFE